MHKSKALWFVVIFTALTIAFVCAKDKPYHKTYALSPKQVLANFESLQDKTFLITGYMESSGEEYFQIKGGTGSSLLLRNHTKALPRNTEVVIRASVKSMETDIIVEHVYTYQGFASNRVILSVIPIPLIMFAFFKEFKFKSGLFRSRKNYDMD